MGSFPSYVRRRQEVIRRRISVRVHPAQPTGEGSWRKGPNHSNIIIQVEPSQLDDGFVVQKSLGAQNPLEKQRRVFAHASNQSLEALFTSDTHDVNASTDIVARCWDLANKTCLTDEGCQDLWSGRVCGHMRSNGWITVRLFVCAALPDFQTVSCLSSASDISLYLFNLLTCMTVSMLHSHFSFSYLM